MTTTTKRVVTVHGESGLPLQLALLDAIDRVLREFGAERVWIDPVSTVDLCVLAEVDED